MKNNYRYESDWSPYVFARQEANFTPSDEIKEKFTKVSFVDTHIPAGGLPVICDGETGYLNTETEMTLIYGETGSKKSRTLIAPLVANLAKAGEGMVLFDIKGEFSTGKLSPYIRGVLEECGYRCIFLDFRNLQSDSYNILEYPYKLYHSGKKDEAMGQVSHIAHALSSIYEGSKADPFWEISARQYIICIIMLVIRYCPNPDKLNFLSIATYSDEKNCEIMKKAADIIKANDNIGTMLKNVLSSPERTLASILVTVSSFLEVFISNENLLKMTSSTTFAIGDLYERKTAIFVIVPDEIKTYDRICGIILNQISATLVGDAYRYGGELPRRVNFICDEFCNYYVPNMERSISAHRSRNIRWYLVCQSKRQLEKVYEREADTITANCANTYFLNSSEMALLEHLSARAGQTTVTENGFSKPLISVQDLQSLKKGWEYTETYFSSKDIHFVTKLPDIGMYGYLKRHEGKKYGLPKSPRPAVKTYTAEEMLDDIKTKPKRSSEYDLQKELEAKFDEIFGKPN